MLDPATMLALVLAQAAPSPSPSPAAAGAPTMTEVLAASKPSDWRTPDPENTLYLELPNGRVVIELAPVFAPQHVANIRQLAREGYYDGLSILRVQENYVVQWGDPAADDEKRAHAMKRGKRALPPEFVRAARDFPFARMPDVDGYAPEIGHSGGFPVGRDPKRREAWLAHCYAMVGAGRGESVDSGSGAELYVVIGHAPRHLDRNITLVGRVLQGMERLTTLPRGTGPLGFYEKPEQYVPIESVRLAADVPEAERAKLEVLRTDTPTFTALVESRRNRRDSWFKVPAGHVELCNVPIPVRVPAD
jgi:peptidylprolyl isomerase